MRTTPENVTDLADNEIFVFGSNTAGRHGRGAALLAYREFGAEYGVGAGRTGQCYAFPTLDDNLCQLPHDALARESQWFYKAACRNEDKIFLVTKVGCGLAGFSEDYMKQFFKNMPPNVIKPEGW